MKPKYIVILSLAALALIFVFQNTGVVTVRLFVWTITASQIIWIAGLLLLGFLLGYLLARR